MKIENDYLIIEPQDKIRETKIFSSKYPALIGASDFTKPGDAMLEMWDLVPKEPFDPFYTLRGEIAEQRVEHAFKHNGATYKHFGSESSKNKVFDLFTSNKFFGGVYDFVVRNDEDDLINCEVKATNIKNMPYMNEPRKEHVKQAELATYLGNLSICTIIYVFFDDESEQKIKEWMNDLSTEHDIFELNVKYKNFNISIDKDKIQRDMLNAYDLVKKCKDNRRIPLALISDKTLERIGLIKNNDIFKQQEIDI